MKSMTGPPFDRIAAAACILLALTVLPLEMVPFASSVPMAAITVLGLALLTGDGLLVLIGLIAAVAALVVVPFWI